METKVDMSQVNDTVDKIQQSNTELVRLFSGNLEASEYCVAFAPPIVKEDPYIEFDDTDGDVIALKLETTGTEYGVNLYRNGELKRTNLECFSIDAEARTYAGGGWHGAFKQNIDLERVLRIKNQMFSMRLKQATTTTLRLPARELVDATAPSMDTSPPTSNTGVGMQITPPIQPKNGALPPVRKKWLPFTNPSKA